MRDKTIKFKLKCPSCKSEEKLVSKCTKCWKHICIICGMENLCKDCFIDSNIKSFQTSYFDEKYEEVIP